MTEFQNREEIVDLLMTAASKDRTVIEFQNKEDGLVAFEVTDHVTKLEEKVNSE